MTSIKKSILNSNTTASHHNSKMDDKFNPAQTKNKKQQSEIREKVKNIVTAAQKISQQTHETQSYNLWQHGVEVLENAELVALLPEMQKRFREMMLTMPEFKNVSEMNSEKSDFVLGGFGAFGTPSSVHNNTSRDLREWWVFSEK